MHGLRAVLWREYLFFRRRWWTITTGSMVAPLLYLVAFGWGLGKTVNMDGVSYIDFLVPGVIALSTMNVSFNAVATPTSIARLYDKTLEEYLIAPITMFSFAMGKILAGALRGVYAAIIILVIAFFFGANFHLNLLFFTLLFLNCLVFSSLGFVVALKIKSHPDMARFNSFVITPMLFICGTFFSLSQVPGALQLFINALPLTPASHGLRAIALGTVLPLWAPAIQLLYLVVLVGAGLRICNKVE